MKRPIRLAVTIAGFATLVVVQAGCDVVFQGAHAQATDTWQRTYKLEPGGQVEVISQNGTIEVSPSADATTVEVVAERRARAATEEAAKDDLKKIEINEQSSPKQIRLEVVRSTGGMHFGQGSREVSFKLKVPKDAAGKVNPRTGEVHVSGLSGDVRADSSNGGIVGENLSAGGIVQIGTTNGSIKVQVARIPREGIRLDTTNGSIDLQMPADSKADITAHWVNGEFETSGVSPEGTKERRRYEGKLNGGGPRIELNTTNGRIRISS